MGGVDITPYIGLARRIASKYHHRLRIPFDDLLGPALEGLVQASMSFRAEKGSSFYGHAERRIMGSIQDYLRSLDTVTRAESRAGVERATMHPIEDAFGLADASPDAQVRYLHAELIHDVVAEMEALPPRTRDMMALYFGAGRTLREIANIYGFTEGRACQIITRGLDTMRTRLAA